MLPFARPGGAQAATREFSLTAAPARINLVGTRYPDTDVWAYNGELPGPTLRLWQGERLRLRFINRLPQESTIHWHGIRLPNAMDGVQHLTQPPVPSGGEFLYEFDLPDAGTFWYHPHASSSGQVGRGLYGALIVEERVPAAVHRELLWVLSDMRLDRDARIDGGFGNPGDASHGGRVGNSVLLNGRVAEQVEVRPGERLRLRLLNAANARIFRLRFDGLDARVVALDGHPVAPHDAGEGVVLGPGMRADLLLQAADQDGARRVVSDDFYRNNAYRLVELVHAGERAPPLPPFAELAPNPVSEPDLTNPERVRLTLGGGAMSPQLMRLPPEERGQLAARMRAGEIWTINDVAQRGHAHRPLFTFARGRSCVMEIVNDTAWHHPFHLHGVAFRVLSEARRPWRDTVLLDPRQRAEIAFVADNPGDWMIHCHILEHQESGMMASMRIK